MKLTKQHLKRIIQEEKTKLKESPELRYDAYRPGESALTDIASSIEEIINNNVGRVDLDFSDNPLTRKDIIDFVSRMLQEQR